MARRGENIHKRKDGRWEGRFIKGYDLNGKAKYGSVYSKSYLDVKRKLTEKKQSITMNAPPEKDSDISLREVLYLWLDNNRIKSKEQTCSKYKRLIDTHIIPIIGSVKIKTISSNQINKFLYEKYEHGRLDGTGGLSSSYVKTMAFILNSSLRFAAQEGLCSLINVEIIKPSKRPTEIDVLSVNEQMILEKYICNDIDNKKLGVLLSLYAGLRIGEVCALKWEDIDLNKKTIHIKHTVSRVTLINRESSGAKTKLQINEAKTISSNRIIPIPKNLISILEGNKKASSMFVLPGNIYPYTDPRTYQYTFHKYLRECGIRNINYHVLRHTFATRCIESGMDVKSLSEILGHSNVNITLNIYVHSSIELKRKQMEKMVTFCGN
ncbi:MAG: site-specific integrase [Clostridia bacterium]|nr:site-specific integrase [Clostridia bacterium]